MPLETATYINQLVTSNPAHSDGLNNADAHMRMIKGVLQAQFPNFTAAALNSTNANIDTAVTAVLTGGITKLSEAGAMFATNTTDGFTNPSAGTVGVSTGGTVATTWTSAGISTATVTATTAHVGPGIAPIGTIIIWPVDTLPTAATEGTWAWCNGQAISRTTYATLYGRLSTTYGAGDGSTTFNLPNYQEVTLVGKSTMGGAASPGLLPSVAAGVKAVLNGLFGSDTHTQTIAEMPSHYHAAGISDPGHAHSLTQSASFIINGSGAGIGGGGSFGIPVDPRNYLAVASAATGVLVNGGPNGNNNTYSQGGGAAFNITQPSRTTNFIIRIA